MTLHLRKLRHTLPSSHDTTFSRSRDARPDLPKYVAWVDIVLPFI